MDMFSREGIEHSANYISSHSSGNMEYNGRELTDAIILIAKAIVYLADAILRKGKNE